LTKITAQLLSNYRSSLYVPTCLNLTNSYK
jgi:hypothetical protein